MDASSRGFHCVQREAHIHLVPDILLSLTPGRRSRKDEQKLGFTVGLTRFLNLCRLERDQVNSIPL